MRRNAALPLASDTVRFSCEDLRGNLLPAVRVDGFATVEAARIFGARAVIGRAFALPLPGM
jgi:hypothetical protein